MKKLTCLTLSIVFLTTINAYSFNSADQLTEPAMNKSESFTNAAAIEVFSGSVMNVLNVELDIENAAIGAYSLVDVSGRKIKSGNKSLQAGSNDFQIDVSDLDFGMYLVLIELDGNLITKRFSIYK